MFFKRNKYFILVYAIILILIAASFYQYYDEYFSYHKLYYSAKENCYEKKDLNHKSCKRFRNDAELSSFIELSNPKQQYEDLDTIQLTSSIVQHTKFNILQFLSPLLIAIAVVGTVHNEISSGFYKHKLMRMNYKDYIKKKYKIVIKAAFIIPISLIIVFVLSCIITKCNFNLVEETKNYAIYNKWKYSNFLLYGSSICLIQFFISILYGNIALLGSKTNKNMLVSIIMSYVMFFVVYMFIYIVVYAFIISNFFGFTNLTDYFNIAGFWYFDNGPEFVYIVIPMSIVYALISNIMLYLTYKNKEKAIIANEIKNS